MVLLVIAAILAPTASASTDNNCLRTCQRRVAYKRVWRSAPASTRRHLRVIAQCESHNDHRAVSSTGKYRGLLQFSYATWATVGGKGDPAAAPRWEQWARGVRLYRRDGAGQWPLCGR